MASMITKLYTMHVYVQVLLKLCCVNLPYLLKLGRRNRKKNPICACFHFSVGFRFGFVVYIKKLIDFMAFYFFSSVLVYM